MELLEEFMRINSVILAIFGVSIYKILKGFLHTYQKKKEQKEEHDRNEKEMINLRFQNLEQASVATLHNKIYRQCTEHLSDEFISIADLDDLDYLFKAYKNLGGNGTGEDLYNEVKRLPKIKKEGM